MKPPKISIVIPSYNKADFIGETLHSIFSQNYSSLEVVVQDGGSTDGTLEIIKEFVKKYPKEIRLESGKDKGQLDAINKGLSKATGEILTYINADDFYEPKAFELIANAYKKNPNALWYAGGGTITNEKGKEIATFWSACKKLLLNLNSYALLLSTSNYLVQPSVFFSKEAYKNYGPFTGINGYVFEYEFWLKLGKVSMPKVIHNNLSKFRAGGANMSAAFNNSIFAMDMKVIRKYSGNPIVVFLHWLNNHIRLIVNKFV
jgi:glycosyltransferase involved in cell wall biosynthesis